ncbi:hypothetical protein TanjilG_13104 [Lupinus angustifolius]|uniref:Squamosa promoter-binding-like protein n=1 Tax=Lupinus angustifolius TaxID=3871 RepID=A0A1J7H304_LUPAN|nr:PREDICTED: squamosa promoter-binding protein 1-like [Lupinus angustifolius]OIV96172.1 hypothetical protein TanjilG_13104 [Lupinus angustifolius]
MEGNWAEGKRTLEYDDYEEEEEEDDVVISEIISNGDEGKNKKRAMTRDFCSSKRGSKAGGSVPPSCQVDSCKTDLSDAKQYHRRHKVCEYHAKAPFVLIADHQQRFCQQCSRFHDLSEFDESKRSCRRRLAGHNERRRKNAVDCYGE